MRCCCLAPLLLLIAGLAASPLVLLASVASLYRVAMLVAVIILIVHLAGRRSR